MVQTQKEYIIKELNSKLEKSTSNNRDFVTFVCEHDFNAPQIQSFEASIDSLNAEALQKHMNFIHDVSTITEDFQPAPAQSTSNEGTNTSAKFVNRPDLAEGCTILTEECNYKATLDFLDNFEAWYPAMVPGCADLNRKKTELYNKLSRHLKTELVSFNTSTHNFEDLKKAIMD